MNRVEVIKTLNKCRQLLWVLDDKNATKYLEKIKKEITSRDSKNEFKDSILKNEIDEIDNNCKDVKFIWEKEHYLFLSKLINRVQDEHYSILIFRADKYFYQIRVVILCPFEWGKFNNINETIIQTFTEDINNKIFIGELTYSSLGIVSGRIIIKDCVEHKKEDLQILEDFIISRIKEIFRI